MGNILNRISFLLLFRFTVPKKRDRERERERDIERVIKSVFLILSRYIDHVFFDLCIL